MRRWTFTAADGVPDAVAPYAHAAEANGMLSVTGQMPIDPATGALAPGGVGEQTDQVMRNLARVLELCESDLGQVLHARAYLTSMDLFAAFNDAYAKWFPGGLPARTCVAVSGLAVGALVEIDLLVAR
jgi:2-iminobutanoate/2-iminopropanoate deaminase